MTRSLAKITFAQPRGSGSPYVLQAIKGRSRTSGADNRGFWSSSGANGSAIRVPRHVITSKPEQS
jgi:hypothetical protein